MISLVHRIEFLIISSPDLAMIARGHGLGGEGPVEDLAALEGALNRALDAVRDGQPYVLDVIVVREYVSQRLDGQRKN